MEDYLKVVTPHLHSDLVTPNALSHLQALAQILPPFSYAGVECRLGANSYQAVDLFVSLPHYLNNLPPQFLTHPIWQTLQAFQCEWLEPTSFLSKSVKNVALEFDITGQPPEVPIPSLFVEFNRKMDSDNNTLRLIDTLLKQFNRPFSKKLEGNLQQCLDALPAGARIIYLGIMLSRPTEAVRIVIEELKPEDILEYLRQIGCFDTTDTLGNLVQTLSHFVDKIGFLDLDVSEFIHAQIGLECFFDKQPLSEPRWQLFFDYLVENGLCSSNKKEAFLAWPGFSQPEYEPSLWPTHLNWGDAFFSEQAVSAFFRKINHIKMVYHPNKPLEAKGYLAFGHRWFDSKTLEFEDEIKTPMLTTTLTKPQDHGIVSDTADDATNTLQKVRNYYDTMNAIIVQDVGKTYQAGTLLTNTPVDDPYRATNLYLASQAGIQAGQRILDAGCGVCGPSIDIVQSIGDLKVDAITLSTAQAETAKKLIHEAGLTEKIQVHVGDYHQLPFVDETFDVVFFFESTGYSYDQQKLFAEVYRVLKKGGKLYVKDVFSKEPPLSEPEQQELADFNRIYAQYQTSPISETVEAISTCDFQEITTHDMSKIISLEKFGDTMYEYKYGFPFLTEFGKVHYRSFQSLPVFFAEIKACKPTTEAFPK